MGAQGVGGHAAVQLRLRVVCVKRRVQPDGCPVYCGQTPITVEPGVAVNRGVGVTAAGQDNARSRLEDVHSCVIGWI